MPSSSQPPETKRCWRKRVGVEPTILAAKDRINGFEGHENHRIPFASANDYRDGDVRVQLFAGMVGAFLRASSRSLGWVQTSK